MIRRILKGLILIGCAVLFIKTDIGKLLELVFYNISSDFNAGNYEQLEARKKFFDIHKDDFDYLAQLFEQNPGLLNYSRIDINCSYTTNVLYTNNYICLANDFEVNDKIEKRALVNHLKKIKLYSIEKEYSEESHELISINFYLISTWNHKVYFKYIPASVNNCDYFFENKQNEHQDINIINENWLSYYSDISVI